MAVLPRLDWQHLLDTALEACIANRYLNFAASGQPNSRAGRQAFLTAIGVTPADCFASIAVAPAGGLAAPPGQAPVPKILLKAQQSDEGMEDFWIGQRITCGYLIWLIITKFWHCRMQYSHAQLSVCTRCWLRGSLRILKSMLVYEPDMLHPSLWHWTSLLNLCAHQLSRYVPLLSVYGAYSIATQLFHRLV